MIVLIVLALMTTVMCVYLGYLTHQKQSIDYKRRWLEAVRTIKAQEDRYRELLETGEPPRPDGPWRLRIVSKPARDKGDGERYDATFFRAERSDSTDFISLCSLWNEINKRSGSDKISTPQLILQRKIECDEIVAKMNEGERPPVKSLS